MLTISPLSVLWNLPISDFIRLAAHMITDQKMWESIKQQILNPQCNVFVKFTAYGVLCPTPWLIKVKVWHWIAHFTCQILTFNIFLQSRLWPSGTTTLPTFAI